MTPRQAQVFDFIRDRIERVGVSPKLEEIAEAFGFSRPRACVIVNALVEQRRLTRKHRGAQGLCLPGHINLSGATTDQLRGELARRGVTFQALNTAPLRYDQGQPCAANRCANRVRRGHLMCREHWFRLPANYRSAIMNAWSARQPQAYGEAVEAARDLLGGYTRVVERAE